jgi:hypothetical protein
VTDPEQIALWRASITAAIEASSRLRSEKVALLAIERLEKVASAACDLAEQLSDLLRERNEELDQLSPPP